MLLTKELAESLTPAQKELVLPIKELKENYHIRGNYYDIKQYAWEHNQNLRSLSRKFHFLGFQTKTIYPRRFVVDLSESADLSEGQTAKSEQAQVLATSKASKDKQ